MVTGQIDTCITCTFHMMLLALAQIWYKGAFLDSNVKPAIKLLYEVILKSNRSIGKIPIIAG